MRIAATIFSLSVACPEAARGGTRGDEAGSPQGPDLSTREQGVEAILKTENLWKVYRSGRVEVAALRGVNLEVPPAFNQTTWFRSLCVLAAMLVRARLGVSTCLPKLAWGSLG